MIKNCVRIFVVVLFAVAMLGCCVGCGGKGANKKTTTVSTVRVTFPEGITVDSIAALLEENNVCSEKGFIKAVNSVGADNEFAATIENISDRPFALEGYLFPDTYDFYIGESPENALSRFTRNMSSKLSDSYYERAAELDFSMDDIIVIASIIQVEASDESEMKNVSSVIHNRLSSTGYLNMLQCDATYFYIRDHIKPFIEQTETETTSEDEIELVSDGFYDKISELYNTYLFGGLPAGPICSPGVAAIEAALYPDDTYYYYFVTDSQGNYFYSETYSQHVQKCNELGIEMA